MQPTIDNLVKNANRYWAHIPASDNVRNAETLEEHSNLVSQYTKVLIEKHELELVLQNLLENCFYMDSVSEGFLLLKALFYEALHLHDLGKINPNFQVNKMRNPIFKSKKLEFGSNHSYPGYFLFIHFAFQKADSLKLDEEFELFYLALAILFGYQIAKHHSSHLDNLPEYLQYKFDFEDEDIKAFNSDLASLFAETNIIKSPNFNIENLAPVSKFIADILEHDTKYSFPLFALLKLHYSLLTASDYLATTHYMNNWGDELLSDFGTIDDTLRKKIINNARNKKDYNKTVYDSLNGFQFQCPQNQSPENLNQLRKELAVEVVQNIRKHPADLIYYIEAPTGGGKTNLSMLALAELMKQQPIKNVYYVFPFTTLITQTYKSLKETLGLDENEVMELHSKAGFPEKNTTSKYGKEKQNHIDYLFANYPLVLLTHVKFFDILKTNRKEANYLLHRLANSVVIVDELQSYPPKHWDKLIYFIDNYARYFNIRFVLMSATLPKIGDMQHVKTKVRYLIRDKKMYFQNPNFCNRVQFDFSLLEWQTPDSKNKADKNAFLQKLAKKVVAESIHYAESNVKYPKSVFTIIEFIYKQTATHFFEFIKNIQNNLFDEVFVLSGTILEFRRKEIIYFLKNKKNRAKKVLLITTQVVEAGVDIDMDLGFKDQSLVDSDEQLAGRINRNVNKPQCKLFLFNCDSAQVIYGSDSRYKLMQKEFFNDYKSILKSKNFDHLYNEVMKRLDTNAKSTVVTGVDDFENHIRMLRFQDVDKEFKIIQQHNESIFVPLNILVFVEGSEQKERNFSAADIKFLNANGVPTPGEFVNGEAVFKLYENLVRNRNEDFSTQKTKMKKLQGIISQFTFSLMANASILKTTKSKGSGEEKLGFYYLHRWKEDEIYHPHFGLNVKEESFMFI